MRADDRQAQTELEGLVTGYGRGTIVLRRRQPVRVPAEWRGHEALLMGQPVQVTARPAGPGRILEGLTVRLATEPPWPLPGWLANAWTRLRPALAWLQAAGWPTLARRLARAPLAQQRRLACDPYRLLDRAWLDALGGRGLTFQAIDYVAVHRLGLPPTHPARLTAGARQLVGDAYRRLHGGVPIQDAGTQLMSLLRLPEPVSLPDSVLAAAGVRVGDYLYDPALAALRQRALAALDGNQQDLFADERAFSDLQRYRYAVLTGRAGTGKTTALRRIAEDARRAGLTVQVCAMTGKAAAVFGPEASTLHRVLGYHNGRFLTREVAADLILVDEASMLTWPALHALLEAARGKILFCGDVAQLPPLAGESVFRELCDRLPVVTLETAHRFVGQRAGASPRGLPVTRVPHRTVSQLLRNLVNLVTAHWTAGTVQVLTPVHFSPLGTVELNRRLQAQLNPHGRSLGRYRVGDRVIVTHNCYEADSPVYNGQTGVVIGGTGPEALQVRLDHGQTVVLREELVELAYAITVHKAQGSQYDIVVLVLPRTKLRAFCDARWEYVGCSRARHRTYCLEL